MILGVGMDLCQIERIEKAIERPRFLERVYTPAERARIEAAGGVAPGRDRRGAVRRQGGGGQGAGHGLLRLLRRRRGDHPRRPGPSPLRAARRALDRAPGLLRRRLSAWVSITHEAAWPPPRRSSKGRLRATNPAGPHAEPWMTPRCMKPTHHARPNAGHGAAIFRRDRHALHRPDGARRRSAVRSPHAPLRHRQAVYFACGPGGNGGDGYACARMYARPAATAPCSPPPRPGPRTPSATARWPWRRASPS